MDRFFRSRPERCKCGIDGDVCGQSYERNRARRKCGDGRDGCEGIDFVTGPRQCCRQDLHVPIDLTRGG